MMSTLHSLTIIKLNLNSIRASKSALEFESLYHLYVHITQKNCRKKLIELYFLLVAKKKKKREREIER